MANWYVGSTKYTAVTQWAALTVVAAGGIKRQLAAPAVGSERCFQTALGGTTGAAEPTWVLTAGSASPADGTVADWLEITGQATKNGDGGGTAWAAPHARLANAIGTNGAGWAAAGDTIYLSNNHAETQATSITLTSLGTTSSRIKVICVSDTTVPPTTIATTASVTTTVTSGILTDGYAEVDGVVFNCGTGAGSSSFTFANTATSTYGWYWYNCALNLKGTNAGAVLSIGTAANASVRETINYFYNCSFTFAATGQRITFRNGIVNMINCTFASSGTIPTQLCAANSSITSLVTIRDSDMSNITGTILGVGSNSPTTYLLQNNKIGAGVTITTANVTSLGGMSARMHNCDSSGTNYRIYEYNYLGVIQQSTSVYRSGGATDGVTPISYQITSNANTSFYAPYTSPPFVQWHNVTGLSIVPKFYLTCAGTLTNGDVWVEWEYLGSSAAPLGTSDISTRVATILTSTASLTTDSTSTWTGGLGNNYVITPSGVTPNLKGPLMARIWVAKASTTINTDPAWLIADAAGNIKSSGRQYLVPGYGYMSETAPSYFDIGLTGGIEG